MASNRKKGPKASGSSSLPGRMRRAQPLTKPSAKTIDDYPVLADFFSQDWGGLPERVGYGVYALALYTNSPDFLDVAADSITEGGDDKDVDLCYIDAEAKAVFVAQCYVSDAWDSESAPSNKADDLLTGFSWLLNDELDDVPDGLRKKAEEVQGFLSSNPAAHVHLLYIHNCRSSKNVEQSLKTVASSAKLLLASDTVSVVAIEISLEKLQHHYDSATKLIVVEESIEFDAPQRIKESGDGWDAVATTISGVALHDLWQKHKERLFSANVRDFLDMLSRKSSINSGILKTVQLEPTRFWAFNNGVTILTKRITEKNGKLIAQGVSVINGAQTTGVLGKAPRDSAAKAQVPCRFIESNDQDLILQIIKSNNTQNAIKSFDLRSNDPVQNRLRIEFKRFSIVYVHRREGAGRLPASAIQAEVVAPHLAAFHGHFQLSTRQRRTIFEEDAYNQVFPREITAEHVYLVQSLADAIRILKLDFLSRRKSNGTKHDEQAATFLGYSTSMLFVIGIVGNLSEFIFSRRLPNRFASVVKVTAMKPDRIKLVNRWKTVVEVLIPLIVSQSQGIADQTGQSVYDVVRSASLLDEVSQKVEAVMQSLKKQYDIELATIRDVTEIR